MLTAALTPKLIAGRSHAAASYGHADLLRWLLAAGASAVIVDTDGDTPLHVCETPECAVALLAAGADLAAQDDAGKTPYHIAVEERRAEMVEWLAEQYRERGLDLPAVEVPGDEDDEEDGGEGEEEEEDQAETGGPNDDSRPQVEE